MDPVFTPPTFVVGTGRCGSTLLSNLLGCHPQVLMLSEFFTSLGGMKAISGESIEGSALWECMSQLPREAEFLIENDLRVEEIIEWPVDAKHTHPLLLTTLPTISANPTALLRQMRAFMRRRQHALPLAHYDAMFWFLLRRLGKRCWIERSGGSLAYVRELAGYWRDARFVHVYRDGRDVAMSMSRHHLFRLLLSQDSGTSTASSPFGWRGVSVDRKSQPFDIGAYRALRLPLEHFGTYWSWQVIQGRKALRSLSPERLHEVRYEDLITRPEDELSALLAFIGLDEDTYPLKRAVAVIDARKSRWTSLPNAERARLERSCRPALRLLGYV